jgi:hypothetical protein
MTVTPNFKPALLTRTEIEWLQDKVNLSYGYQRKIKSDIKKKIRIFQELELPLLVKSGFINSNAATSNCNAATANCNIDKSQIPILDLNSVNHAQPTNFMVGRKGFEPSTPAMSRRYLNQARPPARKFGVSP